MFRTGTERVSWHLHPIAKWAPSTYVLNGSMDDSDATIRAISYADPRSIKAPEFDPWMPAVLEHLNDPVAPLTIFDMTGDEADLQVLLESLYVAPIMVSNVVYPHKLAHLINAPGEVYGEIHVIDIEAHRDLIVLAQQEREIRQFAQNNPDDSA